MKTNLRRLRESRGMTQQELADALGLTQGAIGHYELGTRMPRPETIRKLTEYFGVSLNELFEMETI